MERRELTPCNDVCANIMEHHEPAVLTRMACTYCKGYFTPTAPSQDVCLRCQQQWGLKTLDSDPSRGGCPDGEEPPSDATALQAPGGGSPRSEYRGIAYNRLRRYKNRGTPFALQREEERALLCRHVQGDK
jgi:hypothetical protein